MKGEKTLRHISLCIAGFFSVLSLLSCEEVIDIELNNPDNQRIVVEGRITNTMQAQRIRLTKTTSYFENELAPPLLDANVYMVAESTGENYPFTLADYVMGFYETAIMQGSIGETYMLHIESGEEEYHASAFLDTIPEIDSMNYTYELQSFFGIVFGTYTITLNMFEPDPEGQYYRIDVYLNDTLYTEDLAEAIYLSDFQSSNRYWYELEIFAFPQEVIRLDTNQVRFEMYSLTEEEFDFLVPFFIESYGSGSIFSGPPANIPTNVQNTSGGLDGVGFFAASGRTVYEMPLYKEHDESTNNPFFEDR